MAKNEKKSFILYHDQFTELEYLSMEERGEMITAIFQYSEMGIIPDFIDRSLLLIFKRFKETLDRDFIKYEKRCEINRENGKKGGRPKSETNPKKPIGSSKNPTEPNKTQHYPSQTEKTRYMISDTCNMINDTCNMISENNIDENPTKEPYGLHRNVLLTDEELEKLKCDFPSDWKDRIEEVSLWYHGKGLICTNGAEKASEWKMAKSSSKQNESMIKQAESSYSYTEPNLMTEEEMDEIERLYKNG